MPLLFAPSTLYAAPADNETALPAVTITAPQAKKRNTPRPQRSAQSRPRAPRSGTAAPAQQAASDANAFGPTQAQRTGTVGVYANSTSAATKTNTPLIDIPQSVSVITREFLRDTAINSVTEATRYVPGVAIHQGEGNRDELVIRGVDSSANFYVNGFRDDVQYYRDLYNAQSMEVLKGPSALISGRGAGGGFVNRTLKEADGQTIYNASAQTGSWGDKRITIDAGKALSDTVAIRLNGMFENGETFRDYGEFTRGGINPTLTWKPTDRTKIKLSYEYYQDNRLADRGNPSQGVPGGATRYNPTSPFAPNGDLSTYFGSPIYNHAGITVQTGIAVIEHDFGNGLTVRNGTYYADYNKFYQNVFPGGGGPGGGAVTPNETQVSLTAYNNFTPRENLFDQTDFVWKGSTGSIRHTVAFGTEFGIQQGVSLRNSGFFPANGLRSWVAVNPFDPTYFGPVAFIHQKTDASSKYHLNIASGYAQDQMDVTNWLQLLIGARYDNFDMTATDRNAGITRNRVDSFVEPRLAAIVKPVENVSVYTAYSTSYLPASGDQFSALTPGTLILQPQKFESTEIGTKWNVNPKLLFTAAVYELLRTNMPLPDPNGSGLFYPSGAQKITGFESALTGYITPEWQAQLGYAYTNARVLSATSPTILPGNRVQLVPYNQLSLWNKYQFNPVWAASLGIIWFSDSYASSDDTVRLPGFVRFDAGVIAKLDTNWTAQLNVENIFNKGYYASADGNNNISPGQPRTFRLIARATF